MNTSWLNGLSLSFRCLLLVALCGTATATFVQQSDDDAQDPGNMECNTTSPEKHIGPILGSGFAIDGPNDFDRIKATSRAEEDLDAKIAEASGVVCKLCEDGRRCGRSTIKTTIESENYRYIEIPPLPDFHDGGWKCEITWTGKYKIRCSAC